MITHTKALRNGISALIGSLICIIALNACAAARKTVNDLFPENPDPLIGDYIGRWNDEIDIDPKVAAQVIALGGDKYRVKIVSKLDMRAPIQLDTEVRAKKGVIKFEDGRFYGEIKNEKFTGGSGKTDVFKMEKVVRLSPMLGLEAPADAIQMYDGDFDNFEDSTGWESLENGVFMVTPESDYLSSKEVYRDVRIHLEFRLAHMPRARGQSRSNSGLFMGDEYEVQILDSYGLEGLYNECGALYKVSAPHVNASAPPVQWQTYDVIYRAARHNADGKLIAYPTMNVIHNGVLVHNKTEMKWITGWKENERMEPHPTVPGHVKLQGHGNYVQFRNFWLVDLGEGKESAF